MFNERFKNLRNAKKLSQKKIADILGVSQDLIYKWEKGMSSPDPEMLKRIACLFNVSADYLIGNSDMRNPIDDKMPSELHSLISEAEGISPEGIEDIKKYAQLVRIKENSENAKDAEISPPKEKRG